MQRHRQRSVALAGIGASLGALLVLGGLPASRWFQRQQPAVAKPWVVVIAGGAVVAVWRQAAAGARVRFRGVVGAVPFVPFVDLAVIHSFSESGGNRHMAAIGCPFVGVVWLPGRAHEDSSGHDVAEA